MTITVGRGVAAAGAAAAVRAVQVGSKAVPLCPSSS